MISAVYRVLSASELGHKLIYAPAGLFSSPAVCKETCPAFPLSKSEFQILTFAYPGGGGAAGSTSIAEES
jgi:hypothetical protein